MIHYLQESTFCYIRIFISMFKHLVLHTNLLHLSFYLFFIFIFQEDGILVIPTVADSPLKLNTKRGLSAEFHDRAFALSSIASMSGCCQVSCCFSLQFLSVCFSFHGLVDLIYLSCIPLAGYHSNRQAQ